MSGQTWGQRLGQRLGLPRHPTGGALRSAAVVAGALALVLVGGEAYAAAQCAPRKISATGGNAGMAFFAKSRARTAWTRKVSADARLGPTYAQWLRAGDRRTVCRKVDNRFVCLAIAQPCRSARIAVVPQVKSRSTSATPAALPAKAVRPL